MVQHFSDHIYLRCIVPYLPYYERLMTEEVERTFGTRTGNYET